MVTYYKATKLDGTDFRTGTVDYAGALASGEPVMHPRPHWRDPHGYLSVSVEPAETLIGASWPCRLFEVEPLGEARKTPVNSHKRAVHGLRVVREIEALRALGPQGEHVALFIARVKDVSDHAERYVATAEAMYVTEDLTRYKASSAAWNAAEDAALCAARTASRYAVEDAAWAAVRHAVEDAEEDTAEYAVRYAVRYAARYAVRALVVRHLISPEQFRVLTKPWKTLTGEEL